MDEEQGFFAKALFLCTDKIFEAWQLLCASEY